MKPESSPHPTWYCTTFPSPAGPFSLAVDEAGALAATAFGGEPELATRCTHRVRLQPSPERTASARAEIEAYWRDARHRYSLPLRGQGTPYQRRIWEALGRIPAGETRSYGQLAAELRTHPRAVGQAARAADQAVAGHDQAEGIAGVRLADRNPLCLVVPCHRLISGTGSLAGGAFGPAIKRRLLEHEGALAAVAVS